MQAARIPVSESLLWAAHSPCTVRVTRKLPAIFEWIWSGPCNSSNPRGLLFISWQNHTDPDLCFQSKDSGWGAFSHWVVRPSMEQWPPGLFLHFLLLFFFFKVRLLFLLKARGKCRWRSRSRSRQWRWNPQFGTEFSPPESHFPSPSAVLSQVCKTPIVIPDTVRCAWHDEPFWAQTLFLLENDNCTYFLGKIKQGNEHNALSFMPGT